MEQLGAGDPRRIGSYRLLGRLGSGSMGRVFLARSDRGRTVAVKVVRAELAAQEEFRGRFRREVRAALRVGGEWTAPVLDADTEAEVPWVATGYVAGLPLQRVVRDYGPLPEQSVTVLAAGLAHALSDIHAAGLVHRDLKPSNVMVTIDGPRVIDFGIARALETVADGSGTLTQTGAMVGSPAFMSPEQVRGDRVTPACDVFCLGSVLAYAATGLQPFGAAGSGVHAQMFRIVQEPPDLDAVPERLRGLVSACLTKEPADRPSLPEVLELVAAAQSAAPAREAAEPWLPGVIVAQLGRQAVRLLELDAAADGDAAGPAAPEEPEARTEVVRDRTEVAPARAEPAPAAPAPRRGRRGALVAVLALLAVIAGGATAYVVVKASGDGGRRHDAGPLRTAGASGPAARTSPSPSAAASSAAPATAADPSAPEESGPPGATPAADLVGTWKATYETAPGLTDTRTLVVAPDGTVELTGERTNDRGVLYHCVWSMAVTSADPPARLSPSHVVSGKPAGSCQPGGATSLTLLDGTHLRRDGVSGETAPPTYVKAE
jgi:hypothetical protein